MKDLYIIGEGRECFYRQNGFSSKDIKLLRIRNIEVLKKNERERIGQWIGQRIKI